jgi:hypothetical protein
VCPVAPGRRHAAGSTSAWALGQDHGGARRAKGVVGRAMTLGGLCGEERRAGLALLVGFAGQAEVGKARGGGGLGRALGHAAACARVGPRGRGALMGRGWGVRWLGGGKGGGEEERGGPRGSTGSRGKEGGSRPISLRSRLFPFISWNWNHTNGIGYFFRM